MKKAFAIAGYGGAMLEGQVRTGMLRALSLGAPPHGGCRSRHRPYRDAACLSEENLREVVVLFPMNQRAEDLLMGAPGEVTPKQLKELHIQPESAAKKMTRLRHPREKRGSRFLSTANFCRLLQRVNRHAGGARWCLRARFISDWIWSRSRDGDAHTKPRERKAKKLHRSSLGRN